MLIISTPLVYMVSLFIVFITNILIFCRALCSNIIKSLLFKYIHLLLKYTSIQIYIMCRLFSSWPNSIFLLSWCQSQQYRRHIPCQHITDIDKVIRAYTSFLVFFLWIFFYTCPDSYFEIICTKF